MNFKTILVHLDHSQRSAVRVAMAARWSRAHESHLVGLLPTGLYDGVIPADAIPTGMTDYIAESADYLRQRAEAIARAFRQGIAGPAPLSHEVRLVDGVTVDAVVRFGRASDLLVLGQTDAAEDLDTTARGLPEKVLMEVGRPVLIVPSAGAFDAMPENIVVAWDGSREAAVALQAALIEQFGQKVQIKTRVRETRAEWLQLAVLNADGALKAKLSNHLEIQHRYQLLQQIVGQAVDRIECFDISHTMGEAPIASCVVFDQGGMRKRDYRQYAITDITGGDDYAAMRQALQRRYSKQPLPDLLLIDGGKGQLSSAMSVMDALNLSPLMLGVSKGEGRKAGLETLHFTDGRTLNLASDHKALHLIQQIRDEAHRFAITKHRAKRDKRRAGSVLELIPNLGEKRRRELLAHFGGMQGLLSASEREVAGVKGIGAVTARAVYAVLHE